MKYALRNFALPALVSLALFSSLASAQQTDPAQTVQASAATPSVPMTKTKEQKHADVVEERVSALHAQLAITAEQSKQWDAFTDVMRDNAKKTDQAYRERAQKLPTMDADDAMKSYAALTQQHAENMHKLSSAFSGLYGVLSPEQKQVADTMYRNERAKKKAANHGSHKAAKPAAPASASSAG